jgi:hypothetical protein
MASRQPKPSDFFPPGWVPVSEYRKKKVHLMKDQKDGIRVAKCGATGKVSGIELDGLRCTVWWREVTCPVCKRMTNADKALTIVDVS